MANATSGGAPPLSAPLTASGIVTALPRALPTNLLLQHGGRLLVVRNRQQSLSDLYVLDDTGIWRRGDDQLKKWMFQRADNLRTEAVSQGKSHPSGRALARAPVGGGFPAPPFR